MFFDVLRSWHFRVVEVKNLVIDYLVPHIHKVYYEKGPVVVATPMLFSTATMFLRRALQSPQMQGVKCHPSKPGNTRCTAVKPPCSVSRNRSTCRNTRSEQGQHRQHGGRASVRLYSRDDVWRALACQRFVVQKVADGFRPLTAQGRGTQIPMAGPPVKIDPLTVLMGSCTR